MRKTSILIALLGIWPQIVLAQATHPGVSAAGLFIQAGQLVQKNKVANIMSPLSSSLMYKNFPPFPDEWQRMEKIDYAANAEARQLARKAREIGSIAWKDSDAQADLVLFFYITHELADAALYEHEMKNDAAAIETIRDGLRLADLLDNHPDKDAVSLPESMGIRATFLLSLEIVTASGAMTDDPNDKKRIQVRDVRALIEELLDHPDAKTAAETFKRKYVAEIQNKTLAEKKLMALITRLLAERDLAALSLACHLYRFDKGKWPEVLNDLKPYLSRLPLDPWGNGTQKLGYTLIKGALPDGSDRPLVYSREEVAGDMFYRTDQPQYSYYFGDGSSKPAFQQKPGGQFRDVTAWAPAKKLVSPSTTQPLPKYY